MKIFWYGILSSAGFRSGEALGHCVIARPIPPPPTTRSRVSRIVKSAKLSVIFFHALNPFKGLFISLFLLFLNSTKPLNLNNNMKPIILPTIIWNLHNSWRKLLNHRPQEYTRMKDLWIILSQSCTMVEKHFLMIDLKCTRMKEFWSTLRNF